MQWYFYGIIGLLVLSYAQYTYPETINPYLDSVWGAVHNQIGDLWMKPAVNNTSSCPDINNPVCGSNGITYSNGCLAVEANILQFTAGAC